MSEIFVTIILSVIACLLFIACIFYVWLLWGIARCHVPYVPTSKKRARVMVQMAQLKPNQMVYDLGCGSGSILFEAEGEGRKCIGYEMVRSVVWLGCIKKVFRKSKIELHCEDFFKKNLSDADIIFCYLWPSVMDRVFLEKWHELKTGTKLISHAFKIAALEPIQIIHCGKTPMFVYEKN